MAKTFRLPKVIFDGHNHVWGERDGSQMIARMDEVGIETTLIMGVPRPGSNEEVLSVMKRYPKRFVGGAYYDPREGKKAVDALKRYDDKGLRIVKLFPNLGYYPDDPKFVKFFDAVARRGMAVLSHCGWLGGGDNRERWAAYYSLPGRFEKVIRAHPETIFIMAHMGGIPGVLEAVMLSTRTPNTYVDCTPGQGLWALECCGAIAGSVPPDRLIWGADGPPRPKEIEQYRQAMIKLGYGPHFDQIYYSNARGIFEKLGVLTKK